MIRLSLPTEPYSIDLPGGVTVTVEPCDMVIYQAALNDARKGLAVAILAGRVTPQPPEMPDGTLPDDADLSMRRALISTGLAIALAKFGIKSWTGVKSSDGATEAQVTPQNIESLIRIPGIGSAFLDKYTDSNVTVTSEGNA